eukprot:COSAG02_NODE_2043_length_10026_cov_10.550217_9_plen_110_part_00
MRIRGLARREREGGRPRVKNPARCARRIFDASRDPNSRGKKNCEITWKIERYHRILCDQYRILRCFYRPMAHDDRNTVALSALWIVVVQFAKMTQFVAVLLVSLVAEVN